MCVVSFVVVGWDSWGEDTRHQCLLPVSPETRNRPRPPPGFQVRLEVALYDREGERTQSQEVDVLRGPVWVAAEGLNVVCTTGR